MVNASFLTFRMFETTLLEPAPVTPGKPQEPVSRALWQFMRHSNHTLLGPRDLAIAQHNAAREQINDALRNDQRFPWHLLSLTDAPKFLSDIVESVIGGIYVDSQGSIEACEIFVRKLGILDALERILQYGVDCLHPKERLGHLAVERRVQYVKIKPKEGNGNEIGYGKHTYMCHVKVGGVEIGGTVEGVKRLNAETIAAWKACKILEEQADVGMVMSSDEEWHDADEGGGTQLKRPHS
jgi:dsRNA-specific ribonuclease